MFRKCEFENARITVNLLWNLDTESCVSTFILKILSKIFCLRKSKNVLKTGCKVGFRSLRNMWFFLSFGPSNYSRKYVTVCKRLTGPVPGGNVTHYWQTDKKQLRSSTVHLWRFQHGCPKILRLRLKLPYRSNILWSGACH